MVVNKTTAVLYLIALSLSGFIHTFLRAEERGIYDDVFTADELHHYRINERGAHRKPGRQWCTAVLPCTLVSNEVPLSLRPENHSASAGAPLMLRLAGCGDGGALQPGKRGVAMTVSGSLVTGPGSGSALLPDRKLSGCDHLVIHDGDTFYCAGLTGGRRRCWPPGGKGRHRRVSILMPGAIRPCCV